MQTGKTQICKFFQKPGGCKKGPECHFSHDLNAIGGKPNPQQNQNNGGFNKPMGGGGMGAR